MQKDNGLELRSGTDLMSWFGCKAF